MKLLFAFINEYFVKFMDFLKTLRIKINCRTNLNYPFYFFYINN